MRAHALIIDAYAQIISIMIRARETMKQQAHPPGLYALTAGAFGIGVTEFVIMGLLLQVSRDLKVTLAMAGLLISGYALGVMVGAPVITTLTSRWPRGRVLVGLMVIFTLGNVACAIAPSYGLLMAARVLTSLSHGTFFGVGSMVATSLVPPERRASAISIMFTGLTAANIIGVPFGTWLGQNYGWRVTFWSVAAFGVLAVAILAAFIPKDIEGEASDWRADVKVVLRRPVLLGLLTTVLGFAGVFAIFTYIAAALTEITGFADRSVSPILLVFGGGLVVGNLVGGRWADRSLRQALLGTLAALAAVLVLLNFGLHSRPAAVVLIGLLGAVGFATVAPLQIWVMEQTQGEGQTLVSSLNIAAFNLGNALGAFIGGWVIERGPGLGNVSLVAAALPLLAFVLVAVNFRSARRPVATPA